MAINLAAYRQAGWERYSYLAVAALLFYEYFLQFSNEVELFWKRRWSFGKILFLWSRYYSLAYNISNAVVFLRVRPSYDVSNKFFHWQNTGASLQMVTTHIILELRLYAMYGRTRKILALLSFLILCEACAMGIIFGTPKAGVIGTNNPFPGVFICADGDPLDGEHWIGFYWTAILCIEFILLLLALYQVWKHRNQNEGGRLMRSLTQESVLYFVTIFWIYLANQMLWIQNRLTLNELGTGYSFVISVIFANRLMVAVRSPNYYTNQVEESEFYFTTIRFASRSRADQQTSPLDEVAVELDGIENTRELSRASIN